MKFPEETKGLAANWAINNTLQHNVSKKANVPTHKKTKSLVTNWAINNTLQCNEPINVKR